MENYYDTQIVDQSGIGGKDPAGARTFFLERQLRKTKRKPINPTGKADAQPKSATPKAQT